jgi:hypothetical protein
VPVVFSAGLTSSTLLPALPERCNCVADCWPVWLPTLLQCLHHCTPWSLFPFLSHLLLSVSLTPQTLAAEEAAAEAEQQRAADAAARRLQVGAGFAHALLLVAPVAVHCCP